MYTHSCCLAIHGILLSIITSRKSIIEIIVTIMLAVNVIIRSFSSAATAVTIITTVKQYADLIVSRCQVDDKFPRQPPLPFTELADTV